MRCSCERRNGRLRSTEPKTDCKVAGSSAVGGSMSNSLLLLLALSGPAHAGSVVLDGATWRALQDPVPGPKIEAPAVAVADREVVITAVEGGLLVTARWTLRASEPGWF